MRERLDPTEYTYCGRHSLAVPMGYREVFKPYVDFELFVVSLYQVGTLDTASEYLLRRDWIGPMEADFIARWFKAAYSPNGRYGFGVKVLF